MVGRISTEQKNRLVFVTDTLDQNPGQGCHSRPVSKAYVAKTEVPIANNFVEHRGTSGYLGAPAFQNQAADFQRVRGIGYLREAVATLHGIPYGLHDDGLNTSHRTSAC